MWEKSQGIDKVISNLNYTFYNCSNLEYLDFLGIEVEKCKGFYQTFEGCTELTIKVNREKHQKLIEVLPEYIKVEYEEENLDKNKIYNLFDN